MFGPDYKHGLKGGSPLGAKDTFAWMAGDIERKRRESLADGPLHGEEHPNAWQIFILAGLVAAAVGALLEIGVVPAVLTASWWRIGGVWLAATTATYFGLKALPDWLSGTIMGLGLGGGAGYLGWLYLSPLWAAGLAIGVGAVMYIFFSTLE